MAELTNLTDRISHLRDRKGSSPVVQGGGTPSQPPKKTHASDLRERRMATDYFMLFVYTLLFVALATQACLIVWLDLI